MQSLIPDICRIETILNNHQKSSFDVLLEILNIKSSRKGFDQF
jgi:hypothetical protein